MKANISMLKIYFVTNEVFVYNQQMFRRQLQISINIKESYHIFQRSSTQKPFQTRYLQYVTELRK